jgi:hypothetical protein
MMTMGGATTDKGTTMSAATLRSGGGSDSQTAARLLLIIDKLGVPVEADCPVAGATKVVKSLTRLEKLDFWMRNPDYLADELMTEFADKRLSLQVAQPAVSRMLSIVADDYHYPMMRFKYGAYEPVDNAISILKSTGLVAHRRGANSGERARHDYFLLSAGEQAVAELRLAVTASRWYDLQADAIAFLDESIKGSDARKRQYLQPEYNGAALGSDIPTIFSRARDRAIALKLMEATA